jgi:hypothetical protein
MPKPRYFVYFSFAGNDPWRAFDDDRSLEKAIKRAEYYLKEGRWPLGGFIDSAFICRAEYDEDYEDFLTDGEPIWEAGEPFGPIDADDYSDYLNFWINPYGEIYGVPTHGHDRMSAMLVCSGSVSGVKAEQALLGSPPYHEGWLQVSTEPGRHTTFDFKTEPTQKQMDALFDIVLAHRSVDRSSSERFVEDSMKWLSHPEVTRKNPAKKRLFQWLFG